MGQRHIEELSDWEGDTEDLARLGGQWCTVLGIESDADLSVRLVRDYVQRGIVERPRRDGKVAIFGWEHLVRLLAARVLLRDGWPLQKIADEFSILSLDEIRALLPGTRPPAGYRLMQRSRSERRDPALDALARIRAREDTEFQSESVPPPTARQRPNHPMLDRTILRQDLASSMRVLGEDRAQVQSRAFTRIEIASGVELNIETDRLRSLGRAEAAAIGQAVVASLLDPRHRKEDKIE